MPANTAEPRDPRAELESAIAAVDRPRTWDVDDTAEDWASDAMALSSRARDFLAALDAEVDAQDACDHEDGSTTYLRDGGVFEDTCDTCGEVLTSRTLAQIEAATPGFTAATDRVGSTSMPAGSTVATTGHDGEVVVIAQTRRVDLTEDEEDEEDEVEVCRQCCTETEGLEDVQGTPLCQGCIAYNVSRCF